MSITRFCKQQAIHLIGFLNAKYVLFSEQELDSLDIIRPFAFVRCKLEFCVWTWCYWFLVGISIANSYFMGLVSHPFNCQVCSIQRFVAKSKTWGFQVKEQSPLTNYMAFRWLNTYFNHMTCNQVTWLLNWSRVDD